MAVTTIVTRTRAAVAVSAASLAVLACAVVWPPSADASLSAAGAAKPASLSIAGEVVLTGASATSAYGETPGGAVYYSAGRAVYVVSGTMAPVPVVHASGRVLAIAANSADVFVDVNRTVTAYRRSDGATVGHWTLPGRTKRTSAGLYVVGSRLWAWTDWSTDKSGFEYASVYRITTSSALVHRVSANNAYPLDAAANAEGFYYEAVRGNGTNGYLVRVTPRGTVHTVTDTHLSGPLALAGGRVDVLAERYNRGAGLYLDSYRESTLAHVKSRRVSAAYFGIAATRAGLLAVRTLSLVSRLNATTGAVLTTISVPGASMLLAGPAAAVIAVSGGSISLVRLAG
jgi:hypothetical protein